MNIFAIIYDNLDQSWLQCPSLLYEWKNECYVIWHAQKLLWIIFIWFLIVYITND